MRLAIDVYSLSRMMRLRVVREVLEDRVVDVNAAEPHERRRDLGNEERLDRARGARRGVAAGRRA